MKLWQVDCAPSYHPSIVQSLLPCLRGHLRDCRHSASTSSTRSRARAARCACRLGPRANAHRRAGPLRFAFAPRPLGGLPTFPVPGLLANARSLAPRDKPPRGPDGLALARRLPLRGNRAGPPRWRLRSWPKSGRASHAETICGLRLDEELAPLGRPDSLALAGWPPGAAPFEAPPERGEPIS